MERYVVQLHKTSTEIFLVIKVKFIGGIFSTQCLSYLGIQLCLRITARLSGKVLSIFLFFRFYDHCFIPNKFEPFFVFPIILFYNRPFLMWKLGLRSKFQDPKNRGNIQGKPMLGNINF